ncbi:MAG: hypothetical protein V2I33_17725 [Kangiellaceae bacterium]|jgi:hypothetical protein|nr:hypothetical protein [Kangiellaceae bacterium]
MSVLNGDQIAPFYSKPQQVTPINGGTNTTMATAAEGPTAPPSSIQPQHPTHRRKTTKTRRKRLTISALREQLKRQLLGDWKKKQKSVRKRSSVTKKKKKATKRQKKKKTKKKSNSFASLFY